MCRSMMAPSVCVLVSSDLWWGLFSRVGGGGGVLAKIIETSILDYLNEFKYLLNLQVHTR